MLGDRSAGFLAAAAQPPSRGQQVQLGRLNYRPVAVVRPNTAAGPRPPLADKNRCTLAALTPEPRVSLPRLVGGR